LPTPADSWKTVRRAEDAGFSTAWFYDTQVLSADIFAAMGATAVNTKRIRLGTGVLVPSNRIPPVAANGLATLNALAPGRIDAGFGTGFTARRSMGLGPYKIADMDDYIRVVMAMLRGEKPELRIEGKSRKVGFLNPERKLINIEDEIPAYISALRTEDAPPQRRTGCQLDQCQFHGGFLCSHCQRHGRSVSCGRKGPSPQTQDHLLLWCRPS
jgi:5,10-methylenetetrahydromethanopterin reductase